MISSARTLRLLAIALLQCALLTPTPAPAAPTRLARAGTPQMPIIIAPTASPEARKAADQLAAVLERMCGARFEVKTTGTAGSDDLKQPGILLGLATDFPQLAASLWPEGQGTPANPADDIEAYAIQSHPHGLRVIAKTERGITSAVWDLLHRAGYRQFFPGPRWEITPATPDLEFDLDVRERPAYASRRIWYGYGAWDFSKPAYADWCAKNRALEGTKLSTGHAYDGIIKRNQAAFEANPEYFALVGGTRKGPKICIGNPKLRQLVIDDALRQAEKNPESISMDPSDGGGWCECDQCAKLGTVSDQALTLANEVAAALHAKHPGITVGMYAYNYHSPPPNIRAHPQVVISVATAFIKGGLALDEILQGWSARGARIGIREYYSVNTWDRDLPAQARGGNLAYLRRTIPDFHAKGARFMSAESSDNWGPNGLGYYLAARMLWDPKEATRADALLDDFLTRAFGPAKAPMHEFYRQLDGSEPHLLPTDQLGRMFRALADARKLAASPAGATPSAASPPGASPAGAPAAAILARLDDLTLYAHYVALFQRYTKATGPQRQAAFEALIRHAYRMRESLMVHSLALYRDLAGRDKSVKIPAEAGWKVPEGKNPWKSSAPFAAAELEQFIADGIAHHPLSEIPFTPVTFSTDLVSAAPLQLPDVEKPGELGPGRGTQIFYTAVAHAPAQIELKIQGGLIKHYRDRGNVKIELWKLGGASATGEKETLVTEDRSVPPDGAEHLVKLPAPEPGLYRIEIDDGKDRTLVQMASALPFTVRSDTQEPMTSFYSDHWMLYFYVPKGTKSVGLFGGEHGEVRDSAARPLFWLNGRERGFYNVPVPDGEDGKLWHIRYGKGSLHLLTVPPYLALTPAALLLPAEVVQKDTVR